MRWWKVGGRGTYAIGSSHHDDGGAQAAYHVSSGLLFNKHHDVTCLPGILSSLVDRG
jgi:hypothetical protein